MLFEKVSIIGVGLLGGSLGLAIRERQLAGRVEGYVRREPAVAEAESLSLMDRVSTDLSSVIDGAELTILCTPVENMKSLIQPHARAFERGSILTDVGSVKEGVVSSLEAIRESLGVYFIGSHPMAGGERVGMRRARADLFAGSVCAVTPTSRSNLGALGKVREFWAALGMQVIELNPALHDELACRASHLPHLLASVLAEYVLDPKFPEEQRQLCAGGFRDTTRVASGPVGMWRGILAANKTHLRNDLAALGERLDTLREALEHDDFDTVELVLRNGFDRRERWALGQEDDQ